MLHLTAAESRLTFLICIEMIKQLGIKFDVELLRANMPPNDFKLTINQPTGNFFYDPWEICPEFKDTVWETALNSLPFEKGEARIIKLEKKTCYSAHADLDDRWHLSILKSNSFLIDIESQKMYELEEGEWYDMDAGPIHSAVNFGGHPRIQLVVRKLLTPGKFIDPIKFKIQYIGTDLEGSRYIFDNVYSKFLNRLNKSGMMNNFENNSSSITFVSERTLEIPTCNDFKIITCEL
jgi:hypothetical protein